ncbi:GrpB family protein [Microbacterium marinilacus]|uniref:GrpB family protein n=1 Tax=Microbacterium marinilacus TaxID=415209 RepID=A0ABP7BWB5_9MICO|nr:GrpB family protein [Microbacterium marinilacus]MBY0688181.1 GrpB family protein [Microbacterium marinilacus]
MPTRREIAAFDDTPPPDGLSPWVSGSEDRHGDVAIAEPDPRWPKAFALIAGIVHDALGARALQIEHVGSTSVAGLPAKPVVDVDLIVADPDAEAGWLPPLLAAGFELRVREPWWQRHRLLKRWDPACNLHVFGPDASEPWRHRVFRDHLRRDAADRELYAAVKREAAAAANAHGETVTRYNERKEAAVRQIYARAFSAAGL